MPRVKRNVQDAIEVYFFTLKIKFNLISKAVMEAERSEKRMSELDRIMIIAMAIATFSVAINEISLTIKITKLQRQLQQLH